MHYWQLPIFWTSTSLWSLHISPHLIILISKLITIIMANPRSESIQDVSDPTTLRRNSSVASLAQMAQTACLKDLSAAVAGKQSPKGYCCGGHVTLYSPSSTVSVKDNQVAASPILTLRWDDPVDDTISRKVCFPRSLEAEHDSTDITLATQALIDAYGVAGAVDGGSLLLT